jgi:Na+-transporting NADH:ubiquinone oxidoreductase subunit C
MAVEPDLKTIRGLSFYEQSETPGLGAEITKEWFEKQFEGLVIPDKAGRDARLVGLVRPEAEAGPHEVHGITGATGTSNAVERLLNNTLRAFQQTVRSERGLHRGS